MRKVFLTLTFLVLFVTVGVAQERAIYLTADIPAKKNVDGGNNVTVGGEVFLPLLNGHVVVKSNLGFKDTLQLLLTPTAENPLASATFGDQIVLDGVARIYLQNGEVKNRFFVEGGIGTSFFLNANGQLGNGVQIPLDGITVNQAKSALGFNFNNVVVPRFEFNTQDFTGTQFFGREYKGEVEIFVKLGDNFRMKFKPYVARKSQPVTLTEYGVSIGLGRIF